MNQEISRAELFRLAPKAHQLLMLKVRQAQPTKAGPDSPARLAYGLELGSNRVCLSSVQIGRCWARIDDETELAALVQFIEAACAAAGRPLNHSRPAASCRYEDTGIPQMLAQAAREGRPVRIFGMIGQTAIHLGTRNPPAQSPAAPAQDTQPMSPTPLPQPPTSVRARNLRNL